MSSPTCFYQSNSSILVSTQTPCGSINNTVSNLNCCVAGDVCLSDGICTYSHSLTGGSGYYTSGCVSSNWNSPCVNRCGDQASPDIVYNATSGLWHCCGFDDTIGIHCQDPTDETFRAPAPNSLVPYFTLPSLGQTISSSSSATAAQASTAASTPSSISAVSASSSSTRSSISSMPTPSSSAHSSSGLSTAAQAGIGVGAALAALIIIAAIIAIFGLRKRLNVLSRSIPQDSKDGGFQSMREQRQSSRHELPARTADWDTWQKEQAQRVPQVQADGGGLRYELDGRGPREDGV